MSLRCYCVYRSHSAIAIVASVATNAAIEATAPALVLPVTSTVVPVEVEPTGPAVVDVVSCCCEEVVDVVVSPGCVRPVVVVGVVVPPPDVVVVDVVVVVDALGVVEPVAFDARTVMAEMATVSRSPVVVVEESSGEMRIKRKSSPVEYCVWKTNSTLLSVHTGDDDVTLGVVQMRSSVLSTSTAGTSPA